MSWVRVSVLMLAELSITIAVVRLATRQWLHAAAILVLGIALMPVLARLVTGDVSACLPAPFWSDGADGKDQIILVSAATTVTVAISLAALNVLLVRRLVAARLGRPG